MMIYLVSIVVPNDQTYEPAFVTFNEDFVDELRDSDLGKAGIFEIKEIPLSDRPISENIKGG